MSDVFLPTRRRDAITAVLCERNRKLLDEHGVKMKVRCDGEGILCGHCEHTAYRILSALHLPPQS